MKLFHTTTARVLRNILKNGLLVKYTTGRMRAVWLHSEDRSVWAMQHVITRKATGLDDLVRIELDVPDYMLRRRADGIWYVPEDVSPDYIIKVTSYTAKTVNVTAWEG